MGQVIIQEETNAHPISTIGKMIGLCYGSDVSNQERNYKRGINCIKAGHGRVLEFADAFFMIQNYSARVIREFYTHIGGAPTRVQESTRYIDYSNLYKKLFLKKMNILCRQFLLLMLLSIY